MITRGGQRSNGDAYSPQHDGGSANALYDPAGYDYTIVIPSDADNGRVFLFDATFCAVGHHTVVRIWAQVTIGSVPVARR